MSSLLSFSPVPSTPIQTTYSALLMKHKGEEMALNMQPTIHALISELISKQIPIKEIHIIDGTIAPTGKLLLFDDYINIFNDDESIIYPMSSILKIRIE